MKLGTTPAPPRCSLLTSIFPMPRIIYAIASDGLLPEFLGAIHPRYKTPVAATLLSGAFAATMAVRRGGGPVGWGK